MWGPNGRSCALGAMLLALAGCALPEAFRLNFWGTASGPVDYNGAQFVNGELEAVAESTQGVLRNFGIEAVTQPSSDRILIRCTTKKGTRFVLFLERFPTKDGMKTRVDLAWDGRPDDALRLQLLAAIVALYRA
jgi:hypothetical protein